MNIIKKQREVLAATTSGPWKTSQPIPHGPTEIRGTGINCWICNVGSANTAKAIVAAMNQREAMLDLVEAVGEYLGVDDYPYLEILEKHEAVIAKMEDE